MGWINLAHERVIMGKHISHLCLWPAASLTVISRNISFTQCSTV
jgi:hypothetical protein